MGSLELRRQLQTFDILRVNARMTCRFFFGRHFVLATTKVLRHWVRFSRQNLRFYIREANQEHQSWAAPLRGTAMSHGNDMRTGLHATYDHLQRLEALTSSPSSEPEMSKVRYQSFSEFGLKKRSPLRGIPKLV